LVSAVIAGFWCFLKGVAEKRKKEDQDALVGSRELRFKVFAASILPI